MQHTSEPIAIIGAACRFPGHVTTLDEYWTLLEQGVDAVTRLPADRCSRGRFFSASRGLDGHAYTDAAGVIDNIKCFDAEFFGISRKEALGMDPQQRMALETAWEALESAFLVPSALKGSQTGVYLGVSNMDMSMRSADDPAGISPYSMTGTTLGVVANRISYLLDLRGPSMIVDTACSSSLVAIHQACEALRSGRISLAIAGGVNALVAPYPFIGFSQAQMLSPDGRCKVFDASGNGYVRSEGAGTIILKPLSRALKDRNNVLAVIVGSGVNSDGRTTGISLPNVKAQAALLREIYSGFSLDKSKLAYVEAHGTGTAVGDPIEASAIGTVLGKELLGSRPLHMGSVKGNIGHLEPAAGMAGLLKGLLVLRHEHIPPNIHFDTPNPAINFDKLNLSVPTRLTPLPDLGGNELVSVNSFGFGGTNAHIVLQKTPQPVTIKLTQKSSADKKTVPLLLSANSLPSLGLLAGKYAALLKNAEPAECYDTAATLAAHREHMKLRLVVTGDTTSEIRSRLKKLAKSPDSGERGFKPVEGPGKNSLGAFAFTGNGSQWRGMGAGLLRENKEFSYALEEVDGLLAPLQGWSLLDVLKNPEQHAEAFDYTEKSQPLLFAIQVGLVQALKARGIRPGAVFGHSVGEVAAAWACDALSLEDAVRVIYYRSSLQKNLRDKGGMAVASASEEQLRALLLNFGGQVEIAAFNTASSFTLAGESKALRGFVQLCKQRRIAAKMLNLPYPFHTALMDGIHQGLTGALTPIRPSRPKIPFYSTAVSESGRGLLLGPEYWWNNIRQPVLFHKAVLTALHHGFTVFMEIGPSPLLGSYLRDISRKENIRTAFIPTLTNGGDEASDFEAAWKNAWQEGWKLDPQALFPLPFRKRPLPLYPWNREHLWTEDTPECREFLSSGRRHPLLGWRLPLDAPVFENTLHLPDYPWLGDHKAGAAILYPAAAFIEGILAAGREIYPGEQQELERVVLYRPLHLFEDKARVVRTSVDREDGGVLVEARGYMGTEPFGAYARGRIIPQAETAPEPPLIFAAPESFGIAVSKRSLYETARHYLLNYGPSFQTVEQAWVRSDRSCPEILAQLNAAVPQSAADMIIAPPLLDAAFQTLFLLLSGHAQIAATNVYLPAAFERIILYAQGVPRYAHACLERLSPRSVVASFRLTDAEGNVLLSLRNCRFRRAAWLEHEKNASAPYAVELEAAPHPMEISPLDGLSLRGLTTALERVLKEATRTLSESSQQSVHPYMLLQLASLSAAHETILSLSESSQAPSFSLQGLIDSGAITPEQEYWFCRMLERLEVAGLATRINGQWQAAPTKNRPSAQMLWRTLISSSPRTTPEALLLAHVFSRHKELRTIGPLEQEQATFSPKLAQSYFSNSASLAPFGEALVQCVQAVLNENEAGQRINILQVAWDSASLLSQMLPYLQAPGGRSSCRYAVAEKTADQAEASALLFDKAPCIDFISLDLEEPVQEHRDKYHLIVAACSLHEYDNSARALKGCLDMLAPGGVLCLLEHAASPFTDYVFGSTPRWWKASRERGLPVSLLQPRDFWEEQMLAAGFGEVLQLGTEYDNASPGLLMLGRKIHKDIKLPKQALPHQNATAFVPDDTANENGAPVPEDPQAPCARWLLLTDGDDTEGGVLARTLRPKLENGGAFVSVVHLPENGLSGKFMQESLAQWIAAAHSPGTGPAASNAGSLHVAYMCGYSTLDTPSSQELSRIMSSGTAGLAVLTKALDKLRPPIRLWVITGGALFDNKLSGTPVPSQGAVSGFARVLINEMRWLPVTLLDLHGPQPDTDLVARELLHPTNDQEVALLDGRRYVTRLTKITVTKGSDHTGSADIPDNKGNPDGAILTFDMPGRLQNLYWQKTAPPLVTGDAICVRVKYAGLNFRDVMWSMGMLLDEALENGFSGPTMGIECSGVIAAVGDGVKDWKVGDEVVCFAPACFSSYVITTPSAVVRKPANISFAEAATIPVCFFTAWYSMKHLANLQPGERVLIHGAAGGVGLAAVQIAAHLGLEVYATAGAPEKHHFLRRLGVKHIFSSRSLSFAGDIMAATGGKGVDCVLNSLAGEAISAGISVLKPFGRFIELGKRDFYADTPMRLRPFSNNLSYFGVDVDQMLIHQPALARALFAELMDLFAQRKLVPLPHTVYPASRTVEAFQAMQQASHVGKLVISLKGAPDIARESRGKLYKLQLPKDATYLITGGTGGFGLATAKRLARRGAKNLLLISRRGIKDQESQREIDRLRAEGVRVITANLDVADAKDVTACINGQRDLPPIRGVIHAAAALDDKMITGLTAESLHTSLAAKALGAWNLHNATLGLPLDFFVLYSSATTVFGNPGQAGYVAANAMLESLACWRRKQNLPARVIGWGPIGDTGMLTRNPKARTMLLSILGVSPTASREALSWLEHCIVADIGCSHYFGLDWNSRADLPVLAAPKFSQFRPRHAAAHGFEASPLERIRSASPEEAVAIITAILIEESASVLRLPKDRLSADAPLALQGMDSLMVVELTMAVEQKFELSGYTLPFSEKTTAASLASLIYNAVAGGDAAEEWEQQSLMSLGQKHGVRIDDDMRNVILRTAKGD